jgi:hypothetical protein
MSGFGSLASAAGGLLGKQPQTGGSAEGGAPAAGGLGGLLGSVGGGAVAQGGGTDTTVATSGSGLGGLGGMMGSGGAPSGAGGGGLGSMLGSGATGSALGGVAGILPEGSAMRQNVEAAQTANKVAGFLPPEYRQRAVDFLIAHPEMITQFQGLLASGKMTEVLGMLNSA